MTYDRKCFDLAMDFLEDHPDLDKQVHAHKLAQTIQAAIEDYLNDCPPAVAGENAAVQS
jgi:hypothetical protein